MIFEFTPVDIQHVHAHTITQTYFFINRIRAAAKVSTIYIVLTVAIKNALKEKRESFTLQFGKTKLFYLSNTKH